MKQLGVRLLGGAGVLFLAYMPLKAAAMKSDLVFGVVAVVVAYGLGYMLDRTVNISRK
jgi:hypothetical protein